MLCSPSIPPTNVQRVAPRCNGTCTRCVRSLFTVKRPFTPILPSHFYLPVTPQCETRGAPTGREGCQYYTTPLHYYAIEVLQCRITALPHFPYCPYCRTARTVALLYSLNNAWTAACCPLPRRPVVNPPFPTTSYLSSAPPTRSVQRLDRRGAAQRHAVRRQPVESGAEWYVVSAP